MPLERAEAVVLRAVDFSETSRIVTFLTPERGRLACLAAGVRRAKSPWGGALDALNHVELVYYWKDSRSVQKLAEATLLDSWPGIRDDLAKSMLATLPAEVAWRAAHENEPSQVLFEAMLMGLRGLAAWRGDPRAHTVWHLLRLLAAAGFAPAVSQCATCGRNVGTPSGFAYAGGVTCGSCRADRGLTTAEATALRALVGAEGACPAVDGAGSLLDAMGGYLRHQFEADFRTLRVIQEVCRA